MRLGLTVEGGASRTYFSNGVMDALLEEGIYADYVIGVSAGIANATSYVSRQFGRNLEIGEKYVNDKRYMGLRHMLSPSNKSYYNLKFVFDEIPNKYVPFDYNTFADADCETVAVITNIKTARPEYVKIDDVAKHWKTLIATCSLPILFRPVQIGTQLYMDGGIVDPIPINTAISAGCDKNIVILTRERDYHKAKESGVGLASVFYKKYPEFVVALNNRIDVYNKKHRYILELEKQGKIFAFMPENTDGWGRTEADPQKLKSMYDDGFNSVKKQIDALKKYLYS